MEHKVTLDNAVEEVCRKIGRNILLFQEFERLLKFIVKNGKFSGTSKEIKERIAQQANSINKQTMGTLVGKYIEHSNPDCDKYSSEPQEEKGIHFSFGFQIECDFIYYETKKEALDRMVSERNELVHHLLPSFDMNSVESCDEIGKKLDDQRENIRSEIKELESVANSLNEGRKEMRSFFASEQGRKLLDLALLPSSRLVGLLADVAIQTKRPDGWVLMSMAGQLVKLRAPEEYALLKEKYGYKSLKALILATDIFDVSEEATEEGGVRVLYRLKSVWTNTTVRNININININGINLCLKRY
jgi:hypothetical protein